MQNHNEWLVLVKAKAVLIKLTAEGSGCQGCNAALLEHINDLWMNAGREITQEMTKYEEVWIEGCLEQEIANINDKPKSLKKKQLNKLN